ncbi:MAG: outer rane autotransporter barrel domain protein, partial [Gammaproteobacteria bacterium]|nr:outer rane autotransporter barrel domain protein [Gammaproteobacteria bacterium]
MALMSVATTSTVAISKTNNPHLQLNNISRLVVFGDSYSDNGNTYRLTQHLLPLSPPYYKGRFTDGPMWNEYLINLLNRSSKNKTRLTNYAFGSGMVLKSNIVTLDADNGKKTFHIPSLSQEVFLYTTDPSHNLDQTLFVLYMGSVDLALMPEGTDESAFMKQVLNTVLAQIQRLIGEDAKHIIVFNIHDFTRAPIWTSRANAYAQKHTNVTADEYLNKRRKLIQQYNIALREALRDIPQAHYFDINALFAEVFNTVLEKKEYLYETKNKASAITN